MVRLVGLVRLVMVVRLVWVVRGILVVSSKIIKRLYFKLLQIVSFNTMMLIGMKSSDN